ncbi:UNVERIFIED_CONTAM: Trimethylguanosine synthase [Sesamum latifolium]|uniref:Trimethylguanosine synthase n=1 Tax=Sesamum latifolium TaxID=2727402 RepID=A0AAW2UZ04_9LAMI
MSPAKDSGVALPRTRKQRKRFKRKVKIKAKRRAQKLEKLNERENVTPLVKKYWLQRYDLFSMYDVGVKLDEEGWFSVTPEEIAARQAERCAGAGVVIDAFAGVGGNAIQFAKVCHRVVAVDVDPNKAAKRQNNAANLDCVIVTQWFSCYIWHLGLQRGCSVSFTTLGGPSYKAKDNFTLDLLKPKDGHSLFQVAQAITPNIIMYLPRNLDMLQASELSWLSSPPLDVEIEENFVRGNSKGITLYFGVTAFTLLGPALLAFVDQGSADLLSFHCKEREVFAALLSQPDAVSSTLGAMKSKPSLEPHGPTLRLEPASQQLATYDPTS